MPIYPYKCPECGHTEEGLQNIDERNNIPFCPHCATLMRRAMEMQTIQVRPDIPAEYDQSLGEFVSSRADLRTKLAEHDAYCPDLMLNSEPQAGRMTREERDIHLGRDVREKQTIFDRRKQPGWGQNQSDEDLLTGNGDVIISEGESSTDDYLRSEVKERAVQAAANRRSTE